MAKASLLTLSLGLLILFHGCIASSQQATFQENECQLDRIEALEPDNRVEYEAGMVETWNPNHEQFQCTGVAVARLTIQQNGLRLPQFSNTPQLIYIIQGEGMAGILIPGCPETYQSPQRGPGGQGQSGRFQDRHQKIQRFRQGDVLAIPAGVAHWWYNEGNTLVVAVALFDISNSNNQLDMCPRKFHLAGKPQDEFQQCSRGGSQGQGQGQSQRSCNNIFCGFNTRALSEAFNVDERLVRQLRNENDFRGAIVRVKGDELGVIRPPLQEEERGYESERGRERWNSEETTENGLEETVCTMRFRENIGQPSRSDVYTEQVGRIRTLNSLNLPVLSWLQLSAERGTLENNGMMVPHWNLNAHSIVYSIRGSAHVQVVDNFGRDVFNGEVREGQVFVVPQNFAVVKRATGQRYEWISFKTNDKAMISPLAGRTSVIRGIPEEVLANSFMISREDARKLKFNNQQTTLMRGERSQRDTVADA